MSSRSTGAGSGAGTLKSCRVDSLIISARFLSDFGRMPFKKSNYVLPRWASHNPQYMERPSF